MAGANITIDLSRSGAEALVDAVKRAHFAPADWERMHRSVGERLLNSIADRFRDERDPQGNVWKRLSGATLESRRKKKIKSRKILHERGGLEMSMLYKARADEVQVGSNLIYAALQQFGGTISRKGKDVVVPARPFLGVSDADKKAIEHIIEDRLNARLSGR